jgi:hypothetical protein
MGTLPTTFPAGGPIWRHGFPLHFLNQHGGRLNRRGWVKDSLESPKEQRCSRQAIRESYNNPALKQPLIVDNLLNFYLTLSHSGSKG